jgi:hypothetical protein
MPCLSQIAAIAYLALFASIPVDAITPNSKHTDGEKRIMRSAKKSAVMMDAAGDVAAVGHHDPEDSGEDGDEEEVENIGGSAQKQEYEVLEKVNKLVKAALEKAFDDGKDAAGGDTAESPGASEALLQDKAGSKNIIAARLAETEALLGKLHDDYYQTHKRLLGKEIAALAKLSEKGANDAILPVHKLFNNAHQKLAKEEESAMKQVASDAVGRFITSTTAPRKLKMGKVDTDETASLAETESKATTMQDALTAKTTPCNTKKHSVCYCESRRRGGTNRRRSLCLQGGNVLACPTDGDLCQGNQ